jgi:hypothetical protein
MSNGEKPSVRFWVRLKRVRRSLSDAEFCAI